VKFLEADVSQKVGSRQAIVANRSNASVFVMTFNEEANIRRCLESVCWSNDIVILDSFSTDRTLEIAAEFPNVRIIQRRFEDYGSQRNYGLHDVEYLNPWVLVVDADEVVEPRLALEVREVAKSDPQVDIYLVRRKVFMEGHWLRRNLANDFWIGRLMRATAVRYEGMVHEQVRFEGDYGRLEGALEHHQFTKGIDDWLARRARYARMEAEGPRADSILKGLRSRSTLERRAALKALYYRLPARGTLYFLYNLVVKAAFLDGRAGLRYIQLEARSQQQAARLMRARRND